MQPEIDIKLVVILWFHQNVDESVVEFFILNKTEDPSVQAAA